MAKIALIMPNETMLRYAEEVAAENNADAKVYLSSSSRALATVEQAKQDGALVAVARGNIANIIKHQTDMPLITIQISGQELIMMIHEAKCFCSTPDDLIALIGFPEMFSNPQPVADVLGVNVKVYTAATIDGIRSMVEQAQKDGARVIVGGDIAIEHAGHLGLRTQYLNSTKDSIETAYHFAMRVLFGIETMGRQAAEMRSLLNSTFDAILKLDKEGTILEANFMAERIFHRVRADLLGKNLFDLIETRRGSPLTQAILEQRNTYSSVVQINGEDHFATLNVLRHENMFGGFVLALQGFRRIDDMQKKIREDRNDNNTLYRARHELSEYDRYPSACMKQLKKDAAIVSQYDLPVMILGAPGTRRVHLAESIHNASSRANKPFVHLDLSAMSPAMQVAQMQIEADPDKRSRNAFQIAADGGTVVLEHFECLSAEAEPLFKHILTKHYLLRSDGVSYYRLDNRIICTINAIYGNEKWVMPPLPFDFSYFELRVPSLSERREDLSVLLNEYLEAFSIKYKKYVQVPDSIKKQLFTHKWDRDEKGFRGFVEKLVLLSDYYEADEALVQRLVSGSSDHQDESEEPLLVVVEKSDEVDLINALRRYRGNRSLTARELGISPTTLWRKMKKYNLLDRRF